MKGPLMVCLQIAHLQPWSIRHIRICVGPKPGLSACGPSLMGFGPTTFKCTSLISLRAQKCRFALHIWRKKISSLSPRVNPTARWSLTRSTQLKNFASFPNMSLRRVEYLSRSPIASSGKIMIYWHMRSKIKSAIDDDVNLRYFHASASHRHRDNKIPIILLDNPEFTSHESKTQIFTSLFSSLLGSTFSPTWNFSLQSLYPKLTPQILQLDSPFSGQEIYDAFVDMNLLASPGPDSFEPAFYRKFCPILKQKVSDPFHNFSTHLSISHALTEHTLSCFPRAQPTAFRPNESL